jgi:hypothetical protein
MPVSSIPLCRKTDQEDTKEKYLLADVKEEEEEVSGGGHVGDPCHQVISSASSLMLPANPCDDNLSVASPDWQSHGIGRPVGTLSYDDGSTAAN